jgi:hypothetical protein
MVQGMGFTKMKLCVSVDLKIVVQNMGANVY